VSRAARHSSTTAEHLTPLYVVDAAREALGGVIDVDPATTLRANRDIGARFTFTRDESGMKNRWPGHVFLNPPGGTVQTRLTKSSSVLWWAKLMLEWTRGRTTAGVFICFSVEILQAAQKVRQVPQPLDFPLCVPDHRIPFDTLDSRGRRVSQKDPTHANVIIYLPSRDDPGALRFRRAFKDIGRVRT